MKTYTIKCDLCNKEIDWKNDEKYYTLSVPWFIDVKENAIVRSESHFCYGHDHLPILNSFMSYELHVLKKLNEYLEENRWDPNKKYE